MAGGVLLLPLANAADQASAGQPALPVTGGRDETATGGNTAPQTAAAGPARADAAAVETAATEAIQPELVADQQVFDTQRREMTASGNIVLTHGSTVLKSDSVLVRQADKSATAKGDVVLADGSFRFIAPEAGYAYEGGTVHAKDFRLGNHPLRVSGEKLSGTVDNLEVEKLRLFFSEPDPFALNFSAGSARLEGRKDLHLEDVTLRIGGVPFFYLPTYVVDLETDAPLSFNFRVGYSKSMGAYLQTQTLMRVYEGLRIGANLDGYTQRGVLVGPAGSYKGNWGDGSFVETTFTSGYINDNGGTGRLGLDMLGRPIDRNRYFIDWKLIAGINDQIDIISNLNWWSDSEVTRDYRTNLFNHNQTPDNYAEAVYRGENYVIGTFLRYLPNSWTDSPQQMPQVSFSLTPTEIFNTGIYQRLDASYAHLEEKSPTGAYQTLKSDRLNAYYNLSRTFAEKDWFSFTPVAGVMVTHYAQLEQGASQNNYTRVLGEVGFDAQMLFNGSFDVQSETWGISGLRHLMRPVVQYRYIPAAQSGNTLIPQVDRSSSFQTYLDPIGLSGRRSIDDLYASSTLRIGLENVLQTRAEGYGSRQLVDLNIYQQFNFIRRPAQYSPYNQYTSPRQDTFSDLFTELGVTPADWVRMSVFTRLDPNRFQLRQISTRTTVTDSDRWSAYVGNDYIEDAPGSMINQYVVGGAYRINDRNQFTIDLRIDGSLSEVTEQYYGWQTMLGNSWLLTTQLGYLTGTERDGNFQFRVQVDLKLF